jgi:hypothetical protein
MFPAGNRDRRFSNLRLRQRLPMSLPSGGWLWMNIFQARQMRSI